MKVTEQRKALATAVKAARASGKLIHQNHRSTKAINSQSQHDIKLELDVRCQKAIERIVLKDFPKSAVFGEEGSVGDKNASCRWVVDPIDGTVNFTYGIPHVCVSIALQEKDAQTGDWITQVGVVLDPFCNELWTAIRGQPAKLNGTPIRVSQRRKLAEAIVSIGFAKSAETMRRTLPYFNNLVPKVRKIRMMGAASLGMVYVASGRFDGYVEGGISLWDVCAGGLILECAGGEFWHQPVDGDHKYKVCANNGLLRKALQDIERKSAPSDIGA